MAGRSVSRAGAGALPAGVAVAVAAGIAVAVDARVRVRVRGRCPCCEVAAWVATLPARDRRSPRPYGRGRERAHCRTSRRRWTRRRAAEALASCPRVLAPPVADLAHPGRGPRAVCPRPVTHVRTQLAYWQSTLPRPQGFTAVDAGAVGRARPSGGAVCCALTSSGLTGASAWTPSGASRAATTAVGRADGRSVGRAGGSPALLRPAPPDTPRRARVGHR